MAVQVVRVAKVAEVEVVAVEALTEGRWCTSRIHGICTTCTELLLAMSRTTPCIRTLSCRQVGS